MSIGDWFAVVVLGLLGLGALAYGGLRLVDWWIEKSGGWR